MSNTATTATTTANASSSDAAWYAASLAPMCATDPPIEYLPDDVPLYVCAKCGTHLALQDEIISKQFTGRDGKAYLFNTSINTDLGRREQRQFLTGLHTVADLLCRGCGTSVGWKYVRTPSADQRYKEGKFIMEVGMLHKVNNW
ncbi:uncharacterized protein PFL1_01369 [Pseudozyma flocculosa PF-1]|nr:uncharacterized protein PFL1_01369 [Pseudozyma flocculosa PF-1]EPQ31181.1 hypothetical protein PFL1_01369 [Pseudozyma flocculosa PF-1]